MNLNNMKIGAKLVGGFLVVSLLALGTGLFGINGMRTIEEQDEVLFEKITVPLGELADVATAFQRVRVNLRDIIIEEDKKALGEYKNTIDSLTADIDKLSSSYEKTILSAEMAAVFKDFTAARKEFAKERDQVVALALAGKD